MTDLAGFARQGGHDLRDVVVLLATPGLLAAARSAWCAQGAPGWMPRFETPRTLAATLAPPREAVPGSVSLDAALDRLTAERLLQGTSLAPQSSRGAAERAGPLVVRLVETAHRFTRALQAMAPARRPAWLADARSRLASTSGPGGRELALARLALDWSALVTDYSTDVLFACRPAAWVALQVGGADPLIAALLGEAQAAGVATCLLDLDAACQGEPAAFPAPALAVCRDTEDEAQRAAQCVLDQLETGRRPVGLVALDRALMRRVRALLEGAGASIADETGWTLSTTRAAAAVMGLLRAARPGATSDELVDALKSCADFAAHGSQGDVKHWEHEAQALEQTLRRRQWRRAWQPPRSPDATSSKELPGLPLWRELQTLLRPLARLTAAPLDQALTQVQRVLDALGLTPALGADSAGRRVIEVLHLQDPAMAAHEPAGPWREALAGKRVELDGLIDWVDEMLEGHQFEPPASVTGEAADVVITPLGRALLRPFAALVVPGADEAHLGAWPHDTSLVSQRTARALGLPGAAEALDDEWSALALLLQQGAPVALLRRLADAGAPLAPSPWLDRIGLLLRSRGATFAELPDTRTRPLLVAAPVHRPAPSWPDARLLPAQLSATGYEALRACPYQFHARAGLGLREVTELEDTVDKRDFGQWLHLLLRRFHEEELAAAQAGAALPVDTVARRARLMAAAEAEIDNGPWDAIAFAPYRAAFERFVGGYLELLATHESKGWRFEAAEVDFRLRPGTLPESLRERLELQGRMDRVDRLSAPPGGLRIIDYKARSKSALGGADHKGLEDTQLIFYAALALDRVAPGASLEAGYVVLDGNEVSWKDHADAAADAGRLLEALADEMQRIVQGAPLPALGEGQACERCDHRGLCRRDHWAEGILQDEASS